MQRSGSESSAPKVEPIKAETEVSVSCNANLQDPLLLKDNFGDKAFENVTSAM